MIAVLSPLAAIFLVGLSILVHEWGHFAAARRHGLPVERFSIGFGPKLFSWKRKGTEFCIAAIPIGGYVSMPDLPAESGANLRCRVKISIAAAGPAANLLLAFALATLLWVIGQPILVGDRECTVGHVSNEPPFSGECGLLPGDRILSVDGRVLRRFSDLRQRIALGSATDGEGNAVAHLRIERNGENFPISVPVVRLPQPGGVGRPLRVLAVGPAMPAIIDRVFADSPAAAAGLEPGDRILRLGELPIHSPAQLAELIRGGGAERAVEILLRRGEGERTLTALPTGSPPAIGVAFRTVTASVRENPLSTVGRHVGETGRTIAALFSPRSEIGAGNLMGVAGMVHTMDGLLRSDPRRLIQFLIAINVGLTLLNLLPIPPLDGWRIALAGVEKILRRPLPQRPLSWVNGFFFLLLLALMVHVTVLDIRRWH
jgi:regulator of sigma E protease